MQIKAGSSPGECTNCQKERQVNRMEESWKPVVGWEDSYEVSDKGRVRSVDRIIETKTGDQHLKGKVLSPAYYKGYPRVNLCKNRKGRSAWIHRLVLEAFVGPCPANHEACHWNDNPSDNRLENLRWGTRADNTLDKVRNGNHLNANKTHCKRGHEFIEANTGRYSGRSGRRCKACHRAQSYLARHEDMRPFLQEISDAYFAEILHGVKAGGQEPR